MRKTRLFAFLLCVVYLVGLTAPIHAAGVGGACGENLKWEKIYDPQEGDIVTISGTGGMNDYGILNTSESPWCESPTIDKLVIEDGVTSIGGHAFREVSNLKIVYISKDIVYMGRGAFRDCSKLEEVHISDLSAWCNINFVDYSANPLFYADNLFVGDEKVTDLVIPDDVSSISAYAFCGSEFEKVTIPNSVTCIEKGAFESCDKLTDVYFDGTKLEWTRLAYQIDETNDGLLNATIHYNGGTIIPEEPTTESTEPEQPTIPPEEQIASGACGTDLTWFLNTEGILTISGTGAMYITSSDSWKEYCENIIHVVIEDGVTSIADRAFEHSNLIDIRIPDSVKSIGVRAFYGCGNLLEISIPDGVSVIEDQTFGFCYNLRAVFIPASVKEIKHQAFNNAQGLQDVFYFGTEEQWESIHIDYNEGNDAEEESNIPLKEAAKQFSCPESLRNTQMCVFSNGTDLVFEIGETITLRVGVFSNEDQAMDPSGITFQLSDSYMVKVLDTGIDKTTNCFYVQLEGAIEGAGYINFHDSTSGQSTAIPITVIKENYYTYTLDTVPTFTVDNGIRKEGPVNFYNANGLYVDNYRYRTQDNGSAKMSFYVYNTNYTYGIVEVYDSQGNLYNVVLLNKMNGLNGSLKEIVWDGTGCFLRDVFKGTGLSYKQQTNYSVLTSVEVEIPNGGSVKITADPLESDILSIVNSADLLMQALSTVNKAEGYKDNADFPQQLTIELFENAAYRHILEDGKKIYKDIAKDLGKDTIITAKTVGDLTDTLLKNITELNLIDVIKKNAKNTGIDIGENVLKEMLGTFGDALDAVFLIGKFDDLARQYIDYVSTVQKGAITIQNQGGNVRAANRIVLESDTDFDPEVALQVYSVELDKTLLEKVKKADKKTYELLTEGILHTYDISLVKNGEKTQHRDDVMVYIPIPDDLEYLGLNGKLKVLRMEEDGSMTDMDAVVEGDCIVFTTDHFSLYTLCGKSGKGISSNSTGVIPDSSNSSDNEGNGAAIAIIVIIIVVGSAAVVVFKKKKQ